MRYVIATYTKGDEYHIYVVYCLRWLLPVLDIIPSLHARYFITAAVWFLLKFVRTENCNLCIAEHDSVSPVAPDANNSPRDSPTLLISPLRVSHCCGGDGGRFFSPNCSPLSSACQYGWLQRNPKQRENRSPPARRQYKLKCSQRSR